MRALPPIATTGKTVDDVDALLGVRLAVDAAAVFALRLLAARSPSLLLLLRLLFSSASASSSSPAADVLALPLPPSGRGASGRLRDCRTA